VQCRDWPKDDFVGGHTATKKINHLRQSVHQFHAPGKAAAVEAISMLTALNFILGGQKSKLP